jgi:hypothetical protein
MIFCGGGGVIYAYLHLHPQKSRGHHICVSYHTHKIQYLCEFRPLLYVCGLKTTVFNSGFFGYAIKGVRFFAKADVSYTRILDHTHKIQYLCEFRPLLYVSGLKTTVFNSRFFGYAIKGVRFFAEAEVSYTHIFTYTHKSHVAITYAYLTIHTKFNISVSFDRCSMYVG